MAADPPADLRFENLFVRRL